MVILIECISITYAHTRERVLRVQLRVRVWVIGMILSFYSFGGRVERYNHSSLISKPKDPTSKWVEFKTKKFDYRAFLRSGVSYGTGMYSSFKTTDTSDLQNFVIVQFIKGCHYESKLENGKIIKRLSRVREFFNEIVKYKHMDWVIDSIDLDPVYSSSKKGRHYSYRWNMVDGSFSETTEYLFGEKFPERSELYIRDYPGTAFQFAPGEAMNISLKFKVCLFKESGIPYVSTPDADNIDLTTALACHDWQSSFIFNHESKKFESKGQIEPYCLN